MPSKSEQGYLVLADISGFTSFLAKAELDHAHEVLADLLEIITKQFRSLLRISKLEGDAVFAYAAVESITRGESLLELLEATYVDFRSRVDAVHRRTTCECNACRSIPVLDLKFMTHVGAYVKQEVDGAQELLGSDVNVVHRLLKNKVAETTGWRAYALFTQQAAQQLGLKDDGFRHLQESYEHLGSVDTLTMDMRSRFEELVAGRREFLTREDAHMTISTDLEASPAVVWDWLNDPVKRRAWSNVEVRPLSRPGGRLKTGAKNHCVHGKNVSIESVLDWRPFEYFTLEVETSIGKLKTTYALEETVQGTRLEDRTQFLPRLSLLSPFGRPLLKLLYKFLNVDEQYKTLQNVVKERT